MRSINVFILFDIARTQIMTCVDIINNVSECSIRMMYQHKANSSNSK